MKLRKEEKKINQESEWVEIERRLFDWWYGGVVMVATLMSRFISSFDIGFFKKWKEARVKESLFHHDTLQLKEKKKSQNGNEAKVREQLVASLPSIYHSRVDNAQRVCVCVCAINGWNNPSVGLTRRQRQFPLLVDNFPRSFPRLICHYFRLVKSEEVLELNTRQTEEAATKNKSKRLVQQQSRLSYTL